MLKHDACGEEIQNVQLVSLRKENFQKMAVKNVSNLNWVFLSGNSQKMVF